jgi:hypothetical protein
MVDQVQGNVPQASLLHEDKQACMLAEIAFQLDMNRCASYCLLSDMHFCTASCSAARYGMLSRGCVL